MYNFTDRTAFTNTTPVERLLIIRLREEGHSMMNIAAQTGRSLSTVKRILRAVREMKKQEESLNDITL